MLKVKQRKYFYILVLIGTLLLISCSDNKHIRDLRKYVVQLKQGATHAAPKTTPQLLQPPNPVVYQPSNAHSPFGDAVTAQTENAEHPLQSYPLNVLKFKGSTLDGSQVSAYILAPNNKLYPVKLGDIIGDHYGKIITIQMDRLEVEEQVSEPGKPTTQRIVTLQLKDES